LAKVDVGTHLLSILLKSLVTHQSLKASQAWGFFNKFVMLFGFTAIKFECLQMQLIDF